MLQLCSNAVKFSADGSTIIMGTNIAIGRRGTKCCACGCATRESASPRETSARSSSASGAGHNSKRTEGSGLGLNIVSAIAGAHHGTVGVSSDVGVGSTFVMEIPTILEREDDEPDTDH